MKKIIIILFLLVLTLGMIGCTVPVPPSPFEPSCIGDIFDYGHESVSLDEAKGYNVSVEKLREETFYNEFKSLKVTIDESIDEPEESIIHKIYFYDVDSNSDAYISFYAQNEEIKYAKVFFQGINYDIETNVELFEVLIEYLDHQVHHEVPTNHFLRNQLGCEWLSEIKVDDINEIKIITESVGVAPGVLKNIASSIDKTVISKIYENCYWLDTTPISKEEGQIDGGGATTIRFILNDSTVKEIYINNGNYKDPNADYYKLLYISKFSENDEYENSYGFVTYQDKAEVYWNDTFICEIPMSEIEFVEVDSYVTTEGGIVGEWVLKTEFGDLYFPESHIFHFEDNSKTIYKLTGMRLFKLVEKYSNWWVSQNGQPVLLD